MNLQEKLTRIATLHGEMTTEILKARVPEQTWQRVLNIPQMKKTTPEICDEIYEFLISLYEKQYKEILRIRNLPGATPQMWENYETIQLGHSHEEMVILRRQQKVVRKHVCDFVKKLNGTKTNQKKKTARGQDSGSNKEVS